MIIGLDIESIGLDATKYRTGSIWIDGNKKPEIYRSNKKLWKRVIELGKACAKRKKVLSVYSHNAQYDTAGYVDFKDKNMIYFCDRPFIWAYKLTKNELEKLGIKQDKAYKEVIKFLDTMNIFTRMKLEEVGELVGYPKLDYDKDKFNKEKLSEQEMQELEEYCARDSMICIKAIEYIKNKIAKEGIKIKRLYTINQIARQYLFKKWLELDDKYIEPYFWNKKKGEARRTFRAEEIHSAYRGGRCEAWRTGDVGEVDYYDVASLYPKGITEIQCPDLKTERKFYYENTENRVDVFLNEMLKRVGVSRVLMKNVKDDIGLLQIRTSKDNYYPTPNTMFIGTYTHIEIERAIRCGTYELLDIEWTVHYDNAPNPFRLIMPEIYNNRKKSKEPFDDWFYKMMMNASIGKMAQHRTGQEIVVDNIEEAEEYLKKNFEIIHGMNNEMMFKNTNVKKKHKPYYMPILVALTTAWCRIYMYEWFLNVGKKNLIYTDTDSIIVPKGFDVTHCFPVGNELGLFKVEGKGLKANIMGRKTYAIGNEVKIAGITKRGITKQDFDSGEIKSIKQITKNTAIDYKDIGKFVEEKRDLNKQLKDMKERKIKLAKEELLVDHDIENINAFIPKLQQLI